MWLGWLMNWLLCVLKLMQHLGSWIKLVLVLVLVGVEQFR